MSLLVSRISSAAAVIVLLLACGRGETIHLGVEPRPEPPVMAPKPDDADTSGGDGSRPSFRVFCDDDGPNDGSLTSTSTGAPSDARTIALQISSATGPLRFISGLMPLGPFRRYRGNFVFEASSTRESQRGAKIHRAEFDVPGREGTAIEIGERGPIDAGAAALAASLGLGLRGFGVSSRANYLVLPKGESFALARASDLALVRKIELDPARVFQPHFDESTGVLGFLRFENGRFAVGTLAIGNEVRIHTQAPTHWSVSVFGPSTVAGEWLALERDLDRPMERLALSELKTGSLTRAEFQAPAGAQMSPASAFAKGAGGENRVLVGLSKQGSGEIVSLGETRGQLAIQARWALAEGARLESLTSDSNSGQAVAVVRAANGSTIYRLDEGGELAIIGRGACRRPVLVKEEF